MKKIFISLAAIAALASCVEEKGLEPQPQQPAVNQVTIKAVAAETKTALAADGTSIVWEDSDAISLIFDYGDYKSSVICTTELDSPNSTAEFIGDLTGVESAKVAENINLLYPADAFDTSEGKINFKVPAEQDGTVGSGDNLSYALLTKTEIAGGMAEARFTNALALFKITVPAGVKTVTLTANRYLSGTGAYKFNETGELVLNSMVSSNNTVVLTSESGLDAGTYDVLVYPGAVTSLTLELTGVDGAAYTKTLKHDDNSVYMTLEAGKYYNLKMANLFQWNSETALSASPLGGELEIKASTTADFDYDVTITNADGTGTPDWISTTPPAKGFHQDVIVLYVDKNTSGETREAKVTVAYGDGKSQVFTVTQDSAFMDFVYTDENPIEWEETFSVYSTEADASAGTNTVKTFTNVFTIELSDDFSKGAYKVNGIFAYNNSYTGKTGGIYYANYADGVLTVYKETAENQSYAFSEKEVKLNYDSVNKKFSASSAIGFGYKFDNADLPNGGFIGGYAAVVKAVDEPGTPGDGDDSTDGDICGTYTVKVGYKSNGTPSTSTETITITENNDDKGQYKITGMFDPYGLGGGTYYADYVDGILTVLSANADNMYIGSLSADINMVHNGISFYSSNGMETGSYGYVLTSYYAVPNGSISGIAGTYTVKVGYKSNGTPSTSTETITITENNDDKGQYKITGMFDPYGLGGGTYYADYVDGILTVLSANADNMYIGSLSADINMVLSDISFYSPDGVETGSYGYVLTSYSANKQ